ncbi:hypothetical protein ACWFMI_11970 [Nocardiopsis terrae]
MNAPARATTDEIRRVLDTPRGSRFSHTRTGTRPPTRQQRLLGQMADNPRVAYRQAHGELPHWMKVAARQRTEHERTARQPSEEPPRIPRPRPAPDDGPRPKPPLPPLPRRPRPRPHRPHSHRKPRSRSGWRLVAYALAAATGALAHHLATALL